MLVVSRAPILVNLLTRVAGDRMVRIPLNQVRELAQAALACSLVVGPLTFVFDLKSDEVDARLTTMENRKPVIRRAQMVEDLNSQFQARAILDEDGASIVVHAHPNAPIAMKERKVSVFYSEHRGCWRYVPTSYGELDDSPIARTPVVNVPVAKTKRMDLASFRSPVR